MRFGKRALEFVVIGLGRFGSSLAVELTRLGYHVLGIDRSAAPVQRLADRIEQTVTVDATDEAALRDLGLGAFDTVIVAIGHDFESNLMAALAVKNLGVRRVISKAMTERQRTVLLAVGIDQVILPEKESARRLARTLVHPNALEQLNLDPDHSITELVLPHWLEGQTLRSADLRAKFGVNVIGVMRDHQLLVSPSADFLFVVDDLIIVIGKNSCIEKLADNI
jgi:trk system potassium uptake protein TrkA